MLQSGIDKVQHYQGNKAWLTDFFKASPLRNTVGILMPAITVLELAAGVFSAVGLVMMLLSGDEQVAFIGVLLTAKCFLCLFFGQRIAKDYAGAGSMTVYFVFGLFSLYLFSL